jgi:TolA-binding protein
MFKQVVLSLATAAAMVLPGVAMAQNQFDQVFIKGQPAPTRGLITGMTKDEVTLDSAGATRTLAVNDIQRIVYSDENSELSNARNLVLQKNYNSALTELKKLNGVAIDRDLIKQEVAYYTALCLANVAMTEGGDAKAAEKAMLDFVRSAPNNWHFYDAAEILGELASATGDYATAARYFSGVAKAPWEDYQMRANIAIGDALLAQKEKDVPGALAKYDAVLNSGLNTAEASTLKVFAQIGKAQAMAEAGKADEGLKAIEDIIAKNDPSDSKLFARAYNALGKCYLKLGKSKEALQAFLHTDILFYADSQAHAEALYHLSKLWNDVNKSDRAVTARNTLRERYSGSSWARME